MHIHGNLQMKYVKSVSINKESKQSIETISSNKAGISNDAFDRQVLFITAEPYL